MEFNDFLNNIYGSWSIPLNEDIIEVTSHTEHGVVSYVYKYRAGKVIDECNFNIEKDCKIKLNQRIGSALPAGQYLLIGCSDHEMVLQGVGRSDSHRVIRWI